MKRAIPIAIVRGAGEIGSGVAWRLWQAGFRVLCTELRQPRALRRSVSFASTLYDGRGTVGGVQSERIAVADEAIFLWSRNILPVIADPDARVIEIFQPEVLIDAIGAGDASGATIAQAPCVVGLGDGFVAGTSCHAVLDTAPGASLSHFITAPIDGQLRGRRAIGDRVQAGDAIAAIDMTMVTAPIAGVLRGLLHDGLRVTAGTRVVEIDPACDPRECYALSARGRAVGDATLQVVFDQLGPGYTLKPRAPMSAQ
jgi:xanthine dehydrogenase accessory factor